MILITWCPRHPRTEGVAGRRQCAEEWREVRWRWGYGPRFAAPSERMSSRNWREAWWLGWQADLDQQAELQGSASPLAGGLSDSGQETTFL